MKSEERNRTHHMNVTIQKLCTGLQFSEGPVWDRREERLLFSDIQFDEEIPGNRIMSWSPSKGLKTFREPSGNSNGLTFDQQGNLIVCEMRNRCISSIDPNGVRRVLVDRFKGRRFNAPNDVAVRYDGMIYFTDPEYGIYIGDRDIPQQGLYRFEPLNKKLEILAEDFVQPNGLAFSPNGDRLYVIDSARSLCHIRVFNVNNKGDISGGSILAKVSGSDGMKVDEEGNLYVAGSDGIHIFYPSGKNLGVIPIKERPTNLAWGGRAWRTLYITARTSLYRVHMSIPGKPTF